MFSNMTAGLEEMKSIPCLIRYGTESTPAFHQRRHHPSISEDFSISRDQSVTEPDLFISLGMLLEWRLTRFCLPLTSSKATSFTLLKAECPCSAFDKCCSDDGVMGHWVTTRSLRAVKRWSRCDLD